MDTNIFISKTIVSISVDLKIPIVEHTILTEESHRESHKDSKEKFQITIFKKQLYLVKAKNEMHLFPLSFVFINLIVQVTKHGILV